jgi:predicted secreted protein
MSSTDRGRGNAPIKQKDPPSSPAAAEPAEPFPQWMDRMQRARGRHAAITRNLNTWSSYKNWADRMRESWEDEEQKPEAGTRATGGGGNKAR